MQVPDRYEPAPAASAEGLEPSATAEQTWRQLLARHDIPAPPGVPRAFVHSFVTPCDWCNGSGQGTEYGGGPCYGCNGGNLYSEQQHPYPQSFEQCLYFAGQGSRLAAAEALAIESIRRSSVLAGMPFVAPPSVHWKLECFLDIPYPPGATSRSLAWLTSQGEAIETGKSLLDLLRCASEAFSRIKLRGATTALDPFEPLLELASLGYTFASDREGLALAAAQVTPDLPWIARSGTDAQLKQRLVTDPYPTVITIGRLGRRELAPDVLELVWHSDPDLQRVALRVVASLQYDTFSALRILHPIILDRSARRNVREAALATMHTLLDRPAPPQGAGAFEDSIDWSVVQQLLDEGGHRTPARPVWFEATRDVTRVTCTRFTEEGEQELIVRRAGNVDVIAHAGGRRTERSMSLRRGVWTRLMIALVAAGFPSHERTEAPVTARTVLAWQRGNSVTSITLGELGPYAPVREILSELDPPATPTPAKHEADEKP